jgi:hypothetical protein
MRTRFRKIAEVLGELAASYHSAGRDAGAEPLQQRAAMYGQAGGGDPSGKVAKPQ